MIQSIEKAALILKLFTAKEPVLTLHDISKKTSYNKTTALRFCSTLESVGYIEKFHIGSTPYYRLGIELFHLGTRVLNSIDIIARAKPFLEQITETLDDNSYLFVERNRQAYCVATVKGNYALQEVTTNIGDVLPLNRGGGPLAILASMRQEERSEIIDGFQMNEEDKLHFLERLSRVRSAGFSISRNEVYPDTAAIGSPILNHEGRVVGAVSIGGFLKRFSDERMPHIIKTVVSSAQDLSRSLGWNSKFEGDKT